MVLSACAGTPEDPPASHTSPPASSSPEAFTNAEQAEVDLAPTDEITVRVPSTDPGGSYGEFVVVIAEDTLTSSYILRDGTTTLYSISRPMTASDREHIEGAVQAYVDTAPGDRGPECPHGAAGTVEISGSVTHLSEASPCVSDSPMYALWGAVRDARDDEVTQLAHPYQWWTVEIRPWAGNGPDENAPVENYRLSASGHQNEMTVRAENTPRGWGRTLVPGPGDEENSLPTGGTSTVLTAINEVLLDEDPVRCEDPAAEARIIHRDTSDLVWTARVCPGDEPELLVDALRAL